VVLGKHGGDRKSDKTKEQGNNVTLIRRGNAESYTLARLRRDAPELAKRVEAGEMSANAAAIKIRAPRMPQDARGRAGSTSDTCRFPHLRGGQAVF
jgi:hypothetical protein